MPYVTKMGDRSHTRELMSFIRYCTCLPITLSKIYPGFTGICDQALRVVLFGTEDSWENKTAGVQGASLLGLGTGTVEVHTCIVVS